MSVLHAATPIFLGLIGLEWLVARRRRRSVYALADSVSDLGCGILSQICGVFLLLLNLAAYRFVAERSGVAEALSLPAWPGGGPFASPITGLAWLAVFLLVDLGQYWIHRASHKVSILWACHVVHHSSEELNYAVALRNSSLHGLFLWVFPLPLALAGVPWEVFAICYGTNVAYQFLLHTRIVGRLGPLERVLNTPSHHRVHHGRNPEYVDRNFGGVLILWDRLFGTFREERHEPDYGIHPRVAGSDPVWANLWGFAAIARTVRGASGIRAKLSAVFGPPRWYDAPVSPLPAVADAVARPASLGYALSQFGALLFATVVRLGELGRAPLADVAAWGVLAAVTLTGVSAVMDARPWALRFEAVRLGAIGLAAMVPGLERSHLVAAPILLLYAAASLLALVSAAAGGRPRAAPELRS